MPLTPEPFYAELGESLTASPSASDASTVGYTGHARNTGDDCDSTTAVSETAEGSLKARDYPAHMVAMARMVSRDDAPSNGGTRSPGVSRSVCNRKPRW
ncbi:hypothetical protein FRC08_005080 [Ceratobasidium sp. 394]|nr:hypothetical protein FRC08_005080 [Ceratobasidium sp. 394]KAG9098669.1 hypothetical protein FS749_003293 [Ceratobasidium sp. UAMH 11750]